MSLTAHPIILNQAEELTWEAAYDILTAQDEKYVEYKIHESSFHTLKGVQYLNDEVSGVQLRISIWLFVCCYLHICL